MPCRVLPHLITVFWWSLTAVGLQVFSITGKKKKNVLSSCFYSVQTCQLVGLSFRILEKGAEELGFAIFLISNYPKLPPGHHFPESFRAKSIVSPCTSSEIFWMFSQVPPTHSQKVKSISGRAGACFNFIVCVYSTAYLSLYFSKWPLMPCVSVAAANTLVLCILACLLVIN